MHIGITARTANRNTVICASSQNFAIHYVFKPNTDTGTICNTAVLQSGVIRASEYKVSSTTLISIQHVGGNVTAVICIAQSCISASVAATICVYSANGSVSGFVEQHSAFAHVSG